MRKGKQKDKIRNQGNREQKSISKINKRQFFEKINKIANL